jgi:EAL domain-containing protein (putative c-di-GMP-specific phosphodiesterase class I)
LNETVYVDPLEFSIGACIGISQSPKDGDSLDELLRKADMAMYEAKGSHRDTAFYSEDLELKTKQIADIEKELNHALARNEFFIVYQPQVDALSNTVLGVEALIRWQNPNLGFVPPDKFISVAESTGAIHEIGRYVFETALAECADVCHQVKSLPCKLRVSVNVSVLQLLRDDFLPSLKEMAQAFVDKPITIMVEVTESLFIEDLDRAKTVLEQARDLGVYISLDDFGTGYSSLNVLSKLPINELKIDRSFVNDILTDEQDWLLAKSIINLSKSLAIPVVAEGVETKEQAELLAEHGCDVFQGYYFAKPMRKAELVVFLNRDER